MNNFLMYLLNSTICLGLLYLLFRVLQRKEAFFKLNRIILLTIVLSSLVIPRMILPDFIRKPMEVQPLPAFTLHDEKLSEYQFNENSEPVINDYTPEKIDRQFAFSIWEVILYGYAAGFFISLLILFYGLSSVILLYRKAEIKQMEGYRILIVKKEIPAFSFGHLVFISQRDYQNHYGVILAHEREHIRLNHFYDLIFLEAVKIFYWFNPFIYLLIHDMKDIHEFQADDQTLTKGIDATQYQLLIIQKSVGHQKFALANSFNHCQIKNRIVMMNKLKTSKAWRWKVATFLPMLALLLMAFGKTGEKKDSEKKISPEIAINQDSVKTPEHYHLMILIGAKGKVSLNVNGLDNRQQLLTKMGDAYKIVFSPKELEEFSKINSFGVPMNQMKKFLNMPADERNKPENMPGIPFDSGNNEFKNWVRTARTVEKDMRIDIKGDNSVSYGVFNKLKEALVDLHENRHNLLLAEPVKAYEIAFPSKTPDGEQTGPVVKFTQSYVLQIARSRPSVITIILDKDNSIYYYLGTQDAKGNNPVLAKTDFSPSGIHELLINMNHDALAKVEDLKKKKENGKLTEEDFEKQRIEIFDGKTATIVIIKATNESTYENLMNILDEMKICSIGRYAIIDLADYDKNLISKARL